jgi:hypothetical protein
MTRMGRNPFQPQATSRTTSRPTSPRASMEKPKTKPLPGEPEALAWKAFVVWPTQSAVSLIKVFLVVRYFYHQTVENRAP